MKESSTSKDNLKEMESSTTQMVSLATLVVGKVTLFMALESFTTNILSKIIPNQLLTGNLN